MKIRDLLFRCYWKAESAIVPGFHTAQQAYYRRLRPLVRGKVWLDLGCGHAVFWPWMEREQRDVLTNAKAVYGVDLDWNGLKAHRGIHNKAFANACRLPFADDSFHVVSANMVVEHLPAPALVIDEVFRVLRPGGVFIFHTPNAAAWPTSLARRVPERLKKTLLPLFDGRPPEDVFETHYRINTPDVVHRFAQCGGFDVEDVEMLSSSALTASFGPLALPELLYIRLLRKPERAAKRSNMIASLRKPLASSDRRALPIRAQEVAPRWPPRGAARVAEPAAIKLDWLSELPDV